MAFKMKGHSLPGPHQRKSPAKHTMKFSENTSPGEIDAVGAHNKAHQKGVPADHSKGLVVDKIYTPPNVAVVASRFATIVPTAYPVPLVFTVVVGAA